MKKNCFICSFILLFVLFCITFISACGRSRSHRYTDCWVDATWVISQNDSILYKKCMPYFLAEGDTLCIKTTYEDGPSVGRIYLSGYKNGSYQEIKQSTNYDVNWIWRADTSDTVMLGIVNTSSNDTLQIKVRIDKIWWYTDNTVFP
jgi:hypothetical protein